MSFDPAAALPAVQALTAIVTIWLAQSTARLLHGGLGRKSRLRQEATNLSALLDKLPEDSYGREQLTASLRNATFDLAYLLEFPKATNRTRTAMSTAIMFLTLGAWYWWSFSHPTLTKAHIPLLALWLIAFHVQAVTNYNQMALTSTARRLFSHVDGRRGLYSADQAPRAFLLLHQPSTREVKERAQEIIEDAAEGAELSKVDATCVAWKRVVSELNSSQRCPWYHRVIEFRMLADLAFAFDLVGPLRPFTPPKSKPVEASDFD
ncbi:hypothetical protein [Mycobacteroides abscessus]|uniref:hypothetical protein n=1 Tax=Mycobacteroides abscessus TaxID=36809 RepID=UPI000928EA32|nr:hypothetical protein [Mycobacteroides abscessus]MBE5495632.1 hypothetical protein [Mycobacteroides abscessus]SHO97167.1 Uncharacterised protein [Mycobacteroides abscessus subsp. abscessus]SHP91293.1 Uncharacterised protein [Mycobacteroides abscessus subsp. abscessus]SHP94847.1 Uncharacterised protein [Mycobacteroides abscessus subsp. abscessus]SHQ19629.1 Uncharacterised protein [Mycobacteroides abscessus subsp. abscessus]